ncbi:MAG: glutamyl-tRNA reductase [Chloroflexia bacterium]|nr:glutamyl-tRNA reductase [Chloroflexia bacterium]
MTTPKVVVVGSNHAYAPVAVRERLAFSGESLTEGLLALHANLGEGMILSTCNRTEIYAVEIGERDARQEIYGFLAGYHSVPTHLLERSSYAHTGEDAVAHLFRVASGLDSLVLGEPQILSQIREALAHARDVGAIGPVLQRLATDALKTGKRARTETDISRNRMSIAHAAVDLARHELDGLRGKRVLLLGAGKMATLTGKLIRSHGVSELLVVNRSLDRAQTLAATVGGLAVPISGLAQAIARADLVIGAVMVDEPMVSLPDILSRSTPLLLIDISVPRSISPECELLDGVRVRDVDALEPFAAETRRQYADEVSKVEALVSAAVDEFGGWARSRSGVHAITALQTGADQVRDAEVERTLRKLAHLSERDQNLVRALANSVTRKLTHNPILALREAETDREAERILDIMGLPRS